MIETKIDLNLKKYGNVHSRIMSKEKQRNDN